jgi:hypothetical protein
MLFLKRSSFNRYENIAKDEIVRHSRKLNVLEDELNAQLELMKYAIFSLEKSFSPLAECDTYKYMLEKCHRYFFDQRGCSIFRNYKDNSLMCSKLIKELFDCIKTKDQA